jgi:hypothetical protein
MEAAWDISQVVDTALRERCTRRSAQIARKNAKSPSNPAMTVRYTAKNAFQNAKAAAVNR